MSIMYPHPVLYDGTLDYDADADYHADVSKSREVIEVKHVLSRGSLVAALVESGKAKFFCTVSVRGTVFRRTESTAGNVVGNSISGQQRVEIPEFKFRREIFVHTGVCLLESEDVAWEDASGVTEFHKAPRLSFSGRAFLALSGWKRFFPQDALFHIKSVQEMAEGHFEARTNQGESLRIVVSVAPRTYQTVVHERDSTVRSHVLCAALAQTLAELKQAYKNVSGGDSDTGPEDQQFLESAEGLKAFLRAKKIRTWEDEDFSPVLAASQYKPALAEAD